MFGSSSTEPAYHEKVCRDSMEYPQELQRTSRLIYPLSLDSRAPYFKSEQNVCVFMLYVHIKGKWQGMYF
uniref:Putative ovule protein n=1 Tax=Solanum chacoense TaxID=4108 RepID=A0A0V0GW48_SOLCH